MRDTHWSAYSAYRCRHCKEDCINRFDELPTKLQECRTCHRIPDLQLDYPNNTRSSGEGAAPSHGGPTDTRDRTGVSEAHPPSQGESPRSASEQDRQDGSGGWLVADGGDE